MTDPRARPVQRDFCKDDERRRPREVFEIEIDRVSNSGAPV